MEVYWQAGARYAPERVGVEFSHASCVVAITGVGAMIAFLCVPLVIPADYVLVPWDRDGRLRKAFTESLAVCITLFVDAPAI